MLILVTTPAGCNKAGDQQVVGSVAQPFSIRRNIGAHSALQAKSKINRAASVAVLVKPAS